MSELMREEFEAWAIKQAENMRYSFPPSSVELNGIGDYAIVWVQGAWLGWQASRAVLCVELPPSMDMPDEEECGDYEEFEAMDAITCMSNTMRSKCRSAIHAAGVKTK